MAVNRYRPHLLVLPEDDATRSLAVGFVDATVGQMEVRRPARGWAHVREEFINSHVQELRRFKECHLVLLIDFDDDFTNRMSEFQKVIPIDIADRVYVLGALTEAETLKRDTEMKLGPLGQRLAKECEDGGFNLWACAQLQHNHPEVQRLNGTVKSFLF